MNCHGGIASFAFVFLCVARAGGTSVYESMIIVCCGHHASTPGFLRCLNGTAPASTHCITQW